MDVERGQRDLRDADPLLPGELRLAVLQERNVGAGPAHVEGDQVALAEQAGRIRQIDRANGSSSRRFRWECPSESYYLTDADSANAAATAAYARIRQLNLPTFTLADPAVTQMATIGDFFSHRTGLPGAAGDDLEGFGFDRDQVLSRLHLFPLNPYRISYGYSNFGMTTGGEAVATAAGMPWDQLCAKELFTPAKMTTASYSYQNFLQQPNRATIHVEVDRAYKPLYQRDADPQAPAGGASGSVKDLAQWMTMVLASGKVGDTQVIDPTVLQQGMTPQIVNGRATVADARSRFYGYGVNVDVTSTGHMKWSHSGAFYIGAATAYAMLPAADVGIVALTNAAPVGAPEAVTTAFTDLVRTGTVERDWLTYFGNAFATLFTNHSVVAGTPPASPKPARPLTDYVGTYSNAYLGDVTVAESGGALRITLGPENLSAPLTHYDGDVFSWLTPGQTHDPVSAVTFGGSASGSTTAMNIEAVQIPDLTRK